MGQSGLLLADGSGFSGDYLETIGQALYKALFPAGKVSNLLQRSLALAEQENNPQLHIQIEFNAGVTELNRLPDYPWEIVHDGERFLAHHNVTFSRYIAHLSAPPKFSPVSPINVLLISSGASDAANELAPLSKKEREAVKKGLDKSQSDGHICFNELEASSFKALETYLTENRGSNAPHVLHFDGHGVFGKRCLNSECLAFYGKLSLEKCERCGTALPKNPQGYLLFEPDQDADDEVEANYVSAAELGSLLQSVRHGDTEAQQGGVRLAVLSACKSAYALGGNSVFNGMAQSLIGHGVPGAVAMQYTVSTKAATAFAERFYRELGNKQSLAVATSQGRVAMLKVEHNQWYRLIFYLRWQANDGGQLFANSVGNGSSEKGDRSGDSSTSITSPISNKNSVESKPDSVSSTATSQLQVPEELDSEAYSQLLEALMAAFLDQESLALMVKRALGKNLNLISQGASIYEVTVDKLIAWAEANGRLQDLMVGALHRNSKNPKLVALARKWGQK
jgi:CHAT domain/Effector-associated domain 1